MYFLCLLPTQTNGIARHRSHPSTDVSHQAQFVTTRIILIWWKSVIRDCMVEEGGRRETRIPRTWPRFRRYAVATTLVTPTPDCQSSRDESSDPSWELFIIIIIYYRSMTLPSCSLILQVKENQAVEDVHDLYKRPCVATGMVFKNVNSLYNVQIFIYPGIFSNTSVIRYNHDYVSGRGATYISVDHASSHP